MHACTTEYLQGNKTILFSYYSASAFQQAEILQDITHSKVIFLVLSNWIWVTDTTVTQILPSAVLLEQQLHCYSSIKPT